MPKQASDAVILKNEPVSRDVYRLCFTAPGIASEAKPGMFVNIDINRKGVFLRRPFGIASVSDDTLTIYYRVIGSGTKALTQCAKDDVINVLGPLGNGFPEGFNRPLLVGGGMGLAPLLFVQSFYGKKADILMGGRNSAELFWRELFAPIANEVFITTDDGSLGTKGFTINLLPQLLENKSYDAVFVCGPEIMMRGVADICAKANVACYVSLEKRMACGLGACLSCSCDKKDGSRAKICKDGPVFLAGEVF